MDMKSFAIGIPTLNRADLLLPALLFYVKDFPNTHIYVVDNGRQGIVQKFPHPNIHVLEQSQNLGVAASWNLLCRTIYESNDIALILNDDIYLGMKDWEVKVLINDTAKKDIVLNMVDWSAFLLPVKTYVKVGQFDEDFFPAYYEDSDYEYRMRLLQMKVYKTPILNPVIYRNSSTMEKQPQVQEQAQRNRMRYCQKWGGLPDEEVYKTAYDKPKP